MSSIQISSTVVQIIILLSMVNNSDIHDYYTISEIMKSSRLRVLLKDSILIKEVKCLLP